jgi:voltage-gated potassium channel
VMRDDLRGRVGTYLIATVSLLSFVAALGVYEAERDAPAASITTFGDALWWVLTTITTVGYGDRYPVTVEGRLVAAGLMIAGIAVLGTVTAAIATWFLEQVGARDASEAVTAAVESRAESAAGVEEILSELRLMRARLDELEGLRPAPAAPAPAPAPPSHRSG